MQLRPAGPQLPSIRTLHPYLPVMGPGPSTSTSTYEPAQTSTQHQGAGVYPPLSYAGNTAVCTVCKKGRSGKVSVACCRTCVWIQKAFAAQLLLLGVGQQPAFNGPGQGQGVNPPYNNMAKAQNPTPGQGLWPMQMPLLTGRQGHGQGQPSFSGHGSGSSADPAPAPAPAHTSTSTGTDTTCTFSDTLSDPARHPGLLRELLPEAGAACELPPQAHRCHFALRISLSLCFYEFDFAQPDAGADADADAAERLAAPGTETGGTITTATAAGPYLARRDAAACSLEFAEEEWVCPEGD
ncbi:hypothetical protein B0H11DRAFT_1923963 [Mycena galericulata]|nr:hypothetical protein B0H11DRAFT_1923963 [Mycena galericulata]